MIIENGSELSTEMIEDKACTNSLVTNDKVDGTMKSLLENFEVFIVCAVVFKIFVPLLKSLRCLFPCWSTG